MSSRTEEVCRFLEWDSRFFGINIGRVNGSRLARDQSEGLLEWCQAQKIDCLYLLAEAGDPETAQLVAERLSVPGFLSAARYEAVKGGPKHLAYYELEHAAVMQSAAYQYVSAHPTAWTQRC